MSGLLKCTECNRMFKNKNSLGFHKRNFHGKQKSSINEEIHDMMKPKSSHQSDGDSSDQDDESSISSNSSTDVLSDGTEDSCASDDSDDKPDSNEDTDVLSAKSDITESESSEETDHENIEKTPLKRKRHVKHRTDKYVKARRSKNLTHIDTDSDLSESDSESDMDTNDESIPPRRTRYGNLKVKQEKPVISRNKAMKKIFTKHNLTSKKIENSTKGSNDISCVGLDEYMKVFALMENNKIDEVMGNDVHLRILHLLFNGLKEGWIPICGFQAIKLDLDTTDLGESMYNLIDKFKEGVSKDKLVDLIKSNKNLVYKTFDSFNKSMLHYIELYQDYLNRVSSKIENGDFEELKQKGLVHE